jgi:hypothetical protein
MIREAWEMLFMFGAVIIVGGSISMLLTGLYFMLREAID